MNNLEKDLLNDPAKLCWMSYLLNKHQFSEEFLIETIGYYDSWKCLRTQKNLSPYFCFRYLYDNDTDSADDWTDYNQVNKYLLDRGHSEEKIKASFILAMNDRE